MPPSRYATTEACASVSKRPESATTHQSRCSAPSFVPYGADSATELASSARSAMPARSDFARGTALRPRPSPAIAPLSISLTIVRYPPRSDGSHDGETCAPASPCPQAPACGHSGENGHAFESTPSIGPIRIGTPRRASRRVGPGERRLRSERIRNDARCRRVRGSRAERPRVRNARIARAHGRRPACAGQDRQRVDEHPADASAFMVQRTVGHARRRPAGPGARLAAGRQYDPDHQHVRFGFRALPRSRSAQPHESACRPDGLQRRRRLAERVHDECRRHRQRSGPLAWRGRHPGLRLVPSRHFVRRTGHAHRAMEQLCVHAQRQELGRAAHGGEQLLLGLSAQQSAVGDRQLPRERTSERFHRSCSRSALPESRRRQRAAERVQALGRPVRGRRRGAGRRSVRAVHAGLSGRRLHQCGRLWLRRLDGGPVLAGCRLQPVLRHDAGENGQARRRPCALGTVSVQRRPVLRGRRHRREC